MKLFFCCIIRLRVNFGNGEFNLIVSTEGEAHTDAKQDLDTLFLYTKFYVFNSIMSSHFEQKQRLSVC